MLRFFKDSVGMIISVIMALLISLCMALVGIIRNPADGFTVERLLSNWGPAFLTIMVVSILLPVKQWGDQLSSKLGFKQGKLLFALVSNLVPTFFFNTVTTCVMVGVNVGFQSPHYWAAVAGDWIPMFVASYLLSLVAEKIGLYVVMKASPNGVASPHF